MPPPWSPRGRASSPRPATTSLPPPPPRRPSLVRQRRRPLVQAKPIAAAEKYTLYDSRWAHLFMLSFLAFVSDWVCFATAANPGAFSSATGRDPAEIIDLFLLCNVASCFLFTDIAKAFGLQRVMVAASVLMTAGCFLRSGVDASHLPDYDMIRLGTALVGFSQPFFQCSPPLLSATWFGRARTGYCDRYRSECESVGHRRGLCGRWVGGGRRRLETPFILP